MRIVIAGATGFIGRHLTRSLLEKGNQVVALARNPERARAILAPGAICRPWPKPDSPDWQEIISDAEVIINLAGENIAGRPWTPRVRTALLASRIDSTRNICAAMQNWSQKPVLLLQASAIGFYGDRGGELVDENAATGRGFLAELVQKWEEASLPVTTMGHRRILLRTGVVLDRSGGMLAKLYWPYRLYLGAIPGTGRQWLSWISLPDLIQAFEFLIRTDNLTGIFNLCAPEPVPMAIFCRTLARALHRPVWLKIPAQALTLFLGQMAKETLLISQRIAPKRLLEAGFVFQHPTVDQIGKIL